MITKTSLPDERAISIQEDLPLIPEKLLLAHARGQVLFIAGAGASMPAGLPSFRKLTIQVYETLDTAIHSVISSEQNHQDWDLSLLDNSQKAEVNRFINNEFDVALGMLERRMSINSESSRVRARVAEILMVDDFEPARIHKALVKLADRGGSAAIVTTNFDLLLQDASKKRPKIQTYAIGGIPRPSKNYDFSGVFHIHGALNKDESKFNEIILTDEDFGEFYMRRRAVPDFIYDASRLFHLVFVGYRADDPPMKYLLNAIAADGRRFDDHKERFSFVALDESNPALIEDWKKRGITHIPYENNKNDHEMLLKMLERWADISAHNGNPRIINSEIKRIVRNKRSDASESDKDLFDHLFRRGNLAERFRLARITSSSKASLDWMNAMYAIFEEYQLEN